MLLKNVAKWIFARLSIKQRCQVESLYFSEKMKVGRGSYIHPSAHILGKKGVVVGANSCVSEGSWLNVNHRDREAPSIEIGDNCFIGKQNFFTSGKLISIGDYTLTTIGCRFIGSSHNVDNPGVPYLVTGTTSVDEIQVGVNCFFGAGSTILGNVKVGHGSVIGAGALVLRDIPPFSMVVGNPAKVVKRYSFKQKNWIAASACLAEDEVAMPDERSYLAQLEAQYSHINMPWIAAGKSMGDL